MAKGPRTTAKILSWTPKEHLTVVDEESPYLDENNSLSYKSTKSPPPTIETSPTLTTVDSQDAWSPRTQLTIEHSIKSEKSSSSLIQRLKKPLFVLLGLIMSGSAAYFFRHWLTIPGLNEQIERLELQNARLSVLNDELKTQVGRLSGEVDRLESEINRFSNQTDRYSDINGQLSSNITELVFQNDRLNTSLLMFADENAKLNQSVIALESANDDLILQVDQYRSLNNELNSTASQLRVEVDQLDILTTELEAANVDLWQAIDVLSNNTERLAILNQNLNQTAEGLERQVSVLSTEVDRLDQLTANLASVVGFLNETVDTFDGSLDDFTAYLASQTDYYRAVVLDSLELIQRQQTSNWDCDFRSLFATESFVNNRTQPIGDSLYKDVLAYVNTSILSDLCLSDNDFETYLESEVVNSGSFPPTSVSFNQLSSAVSTYTTLALQYYFPQDGEVDVGVSPLEWSQASYKCEKLDVQKQYRYA